jgi:hypothetical protein
VFENRVLRIILGLKRDEITREWRKLHEELHDLYSSPNIIRVIKSRGMRWAGHIAPLGEMRGAYRVFVGKLERKRLLGIPRRRRENNTKMNLQEVGMGAWTGLICSHVQVNCLNTFFRQIARRAELPESVILIFSFCYRDYKCVWNCPSTPHPPPYMSAYNMIRTEITIV